MSTRRSAALFAAAAAFAHAAASARAASFSCAAGDVACLVNAIRIANNGVPWAPNTITLAAGTYHLTSPDTTGPEGSDGLPPVNSHITIVGAGMSATILQRDSGAPDFRIFDVSSLGVLALQSLSIQGGSAVSDPTLSQYGGLGIRNLGNTILTDAAVRGMSGSVEGGAINNASGSLTLLRALVENNSVRGDGAGIFNRGVMQIRRSTIRNNVAQAGSGGGIYTGSTSSITGSAITGNHAGTGGGIVAHGDLTISSSTIAQNSIDSGAGGGGIVVDAGTVQLVHCTVADNVLSSVFATGGGGILQRGGTVDLHDTILARNTWFHGFDDPQYSTPWDCAGTITSAGHNVVGDNTNCTIALQSTDHLGDAGLGVFTDQIRAADGSPEGNGQIPLLAGSPAIDGGSYSCPAGDQLGYPPVDANLDCGQTCDVGAVEYAPVVNSWIALANSKKTRGSGTKTYPAGILTVRQHYRNIYPLPIGYPVFVLSSLSSNAVLLNGDSPNPGGVGSRMTSNAGGDWIWSAGEAITVTWIFGLRSGSSVAFSADALGFPDYP